MRTLEVICAALLTVRLTIDCVHNAYRSIGGTTRRHPTPQAGSDTVEGRVIGLSIDVLFATYTTIALMVLWRALL